MKTWRIIGALCQAVVLGTLLFIAVARLIIFSAGASVFKYQGF
jgi:hypothetical protein